MPHPLFLLIFFSALSFFVSATWAEDPIPDVKANGSDDPIIIRQSDTLSVTVELTAGNMAGIDADWWLGAYATPFGLFYYDVVSDSWKPNLTCTYQGPLFDLDPYEVLNMSGLPPGIYIFCFAVDLNMSCSIDISQTYYDCVEVTVLPFKD